ncbi:MAG: hypothetical protein SOV58_05080 [Candidatus Enteromonas sp.]|nr:hypothetical protein [Candidatus Enteromonas sp.]
MSKALTNELIQSNGLIIEGLKRLYRLNVGERLYDLEFTSPYRLTIGGETVETVAWGELLVKTVLILLDMYPGRESQLLSFKTDWSNAAMFSEKNRTNFAQLKEGVYININHTSLHSCWFLYDLLEWFEVNYSKCDFLIHRMPKAEPKEIRDAIRSDVKAALKDFLIWKKLLPADKAEKQIKNLEFLNKKFKEMRSTSGYDDLFLFDDLNFYSNAKSKFISDLKSKVFSTEPKKVEICRRCLDYLTDFYPTYKY